MTIEPAKLHRLKNQLAIILGFCELLLEDTSDERARADLQEIQRAAHSALGELPPLPAHEFDSTLNRPPEANNGD